MLQQLRALSFSRKLIPFTIIKCIAGQPIPLYGKGDNIRDWLYVDDHVRALQNVFENSIVGESYMIGGNSDSTNLEVVNMVCETLDRIRPKADGGSYSTRLHSLPIGQVMIIGVLSIPASFKMT